jgi:hypothetical protein
MYEIDDGLKEFVESGVATIVGAGDVDGRPQIANGWAPRVEADRRTLHLFLDTARADTFIGRLHANRRIAVTIAEPTSYRSVQFKGVVVGETSVPDKAELAWVQKQRDAFVASTSLVGDPPDIIRSMWLEDVVRIAVAVERAFNQTPGPDAGKPL